MTSALSFPNESSLDCAIKPRLGFVGTGWIGRLRMEALQNADCSEFVCVYDPDDQAAQAAAELAPDIQIAPSFASLLEQDIDGVVLATPSAYHASQTIEAFAQGKAVFCQKPLARTAYETQQVVDAAKAHDCLLGVDFSYRHLHGINTLREVISRGEIGEVFAADLIFHNAYGPDKPWFYDMQSSGGGCVMDLGIHLVDLAMWLLKPKEIEMHSSRLYSNGKRLRAPIDAVEDYAHANFSLDNTHVHLCCSWNLHAGRDAVIEARFFGTKGGLAILNTNGSFFDFEILRFNGTSQEKVGGLPGDPWGGRALYQWAQQLAVRLQYDPAVEHAVAVSEVLDRIYQR